MQKIVKTLKILRGYLIINCQIECTLGLPNLRIKNKKIHGTKHLRLFAANPTHIPHAAANSADVTVSCKFWGRAKHRQNSFKQT